jgi:hypothetical protein
MFDKTREKISDAMEVRIAQPVRNIGLIAIAALLTGIVALIIAVRR